ncbi:MAG TPA: NADH-quinone oxidoreductase subunit NuoG [Prolixibacteraceae bacterium]|nr:NADH-quinone oxidoreductase subunit NuoG [Prolixibacteraceae bacterium]
MEGMIKIDIDGKTYEVKPGKNLLETCLSLGLDLPYFCYHPALGAVGACRQCAVKRYKDANDKQGRIIMSCMEPVAEGMIISVNDLQAKAFRESIIESLMLNHPHDCPVCDEGGECHLQDMTLMTGHAYRRNRFKKRTYQNQYLGPFVNHEMNRCIQCYRCVRFYRDYAGGKDLDVFASHDNVYFGRQQEGTLENEFSGNLAEVCPTGVFTDKTLKNHYTRKWDLTNTPSVCVHCSVGCNTISGERYGMLRRTMSRYNGAVNGYFLCDRGRFGYEFVNSASRIRHHYLRNWENGLLIKATHEASATALSEALIQSKKIIGIGSPRASLEANFALSALVGMGNFYSGFSQSEQSLIDLSLKILKQGIAHNPSLKEMEKADAVFILGEDVINTAPMVGLAIRQASKTVPTGMAAKSGIPAWHNNALQSLMQHQKSPIFIASPFKTKLDDLSEINFRGTPDSIVTLGESVASFINHQGEPSANPGNGDKEAQKVAERIASALINAQNPLIVTGIHSNSPPLLKASAAIARALSLAGKKTSLSILFPECNSVGHGMMGAKPTEEAFELVRKGNADTVIILENDLYRRADRKTIDRFLSSGITTIVMDHLANETTQKASILLPVGTYAESEGTLVNHEGRAQRFYQALPAKGSVMESWRQISEMIRLRNKDVEGWHTFDQVVEAMTNALSQFGKVKEYLPHADFRMLSEKIKRQTPRFSGRTAIRANVNVSEPKPPDDLDSPLAFSMEGTDQAPPSSLVTYYWKPGWNSYQAMNFYLDEPNGSMKGGDPGIRLLDDQKTPAPTVSAADESMPAKANEWVILPVYCIFGSEELSAEGQAVKERIPQPFVLVNSKNAPILPVNDDGAFSLNIGEKILQVRARMDDSIPEGIIGLSVNLPGMDYIELPAYGKIS